MAEELKVFFSLDDGAGQQLIVRGPLSLLDRFIVTLTAHRSPALLEVTRLRAILGDLQLAIVNERPYSELFNLTEQALGQEAEL